MSAWCLWPLKPRSRLARSRTGIQQERALGKPGWATTALLPAALYLPRPPTHPTPFCQSPCRTAASRRRPRPRQLPRQAASVDRANPSQTFNRRNPGHTPQVPLDSCGPEVMAQEAQTHAHTLAQDQAQPPYGAVAGTGGGDTAPSQSSPSAPAPGSSSGQGAGPDAASSAAQAQAAQHKRVYQACIPCRRRKVRCDLGSVDNPHDPPCVRCRRESKDCYFSATRRKRKTEEDEREDEYIVRNGRKRLHPEDSPPPPAERRVYTDTPLTPGGSLGRPQPLRRPGLGEHARSDSRSSISASRGPSAADFPADEPNTPLENYEARTVMRKELYGPHDALDLLYKAATDNKHDDVVQSHTLSTQTSNLRTPSLNAPLGGLPRGDDGLLYAQHVVTQRGPMDAPIDPQLTKSDAKAEPTPAHADALKAWARFRFVRAGWFTSQEAIDYID